MHEGRAPHGTNLAVAEEAGDGQRAEAVGDGGGAVGEADRDGSVGGKLGCLELQGREVEVRGSLGEMKHLHANHFV